MIYHTIKSSRKFKVFRYSQKSLKISPSTLFSIPSPCAHVRVAPYWHSRAKQIRTTALQRPPKFKRAYFLWQWRIEVFGLAGNSNQEKNLNCVQQKVLSSSVLCYFTHEITAIYYEGNNTFQIKEQLNKTLSKIAGQKYKNENFA